MFFYGNIEELNREQQIDHLRRIERDRLVRKAAMTNTGPGFWRQFHHAVYKGLQIMRSCG